MAQTRDERIALRIPGDVRRALDAAAKADRRTMSDLIVIVLSDWLTAKSYLKPEPKRRARGGK